MQSDEEIAELRDRLATEPTELPDSFMDLREADMAEVLNQLSVVEASHVVAHLPLPRAIQLCNNRTLRRRAESPRVLWRLWGAAESHSTRRSLNPHSVRRGPFVAGSSPCRGNSELIDGDLEDVL
jgi:hypothetical protein